MLFSVALIYLINCNVIRCWPWNSPTETKRDISIRYKHLEPVSRFCQESIMESQNVRSGHDEGNSDDDSCSAPAINILRRGTNSFENNLYGYNPKKTYKPVLNISCPHDTSKWRKITYFQTEGTTQFANQLVTKETITASFADNQQLVEEVYKMGSAVQRKISLRDNYNATLLSCNVEVMGANLNADSKLLDSTNSEYLKLPLILSNNVPLYYNFVRTFGTHIFTRVQLGGVMTVLASTDRVQNIMSTKNIEMDNPAIFDELITGKGPIDDLFSFKIIGGHYVNDLFEWIPTVHRHPLPLRADYIPIADYIEKTTKVSSMRKINFQTVYEFEQRRSLILWGVYKLQNTDNLTVLEKFILQNLKNEMDKMCPSDSTYDMIKVATKTKNMKYGVICTVINTSFFGQDEVQHKIIPLLEGVCVTFAKIEKQCDIMEVVLEGKGKYIMLYEMEDCQKDSPNYKVKGLTHFNSVFNKTRSMVMLGYGTRE